MGMKNGSLSLRVLYSQVPLSTGILVDMKSRPTPPADKVGEDPVMYWIEPREFAGYCLVTLRMAQRRVAKNELDAEVKKEVEAYERATNQKLNRRKISEIRVAVKERLIPQASIVTRDIELLWRPGDHFLYTTATSETALNRVRGMWTVLTSKPVLGLWLEDIAKLDASLDLRLATPARFSPTTPPAELLELEKEFLTWLWYKIENHQRVAGYADALVREPLALSGGIDDGTVTVKGGRATASAEAARALDSGKLLTKISLTLAEDPETFYGLTVTKDSCLCGLRFPPTELPASDVAGQFQERVVWMERAWTFLRAAAVEFGQLRLTPDEWKAEERKVRDWVNKKCGRGEEVEG